MLKRYRFFFPFFYLNTLRTRNLFYRFYKCNLLLSFFFTHLIAIGDAETWQRDLVYTFTFAPLLLFKLEIVAMTKDSTSVCIKKELKSILSLWSLKAKSSRKTAKNFCSLVFSELKGFTEIMYIYLDNLREYFWDNIVNLF